MCISPHPDLPADIRTDREGPEFFYDGPARVRDIYEIEIQVFGTPDCDNACRLSFAYDKVEREHTQWLQRKDHKFLSCSPFPCFGNRLFGRVFTGHGGSPPRFPDPATGFAASESSPGLSGGTVDGSLCRDSVRCSTCCTAAGVDPPGVFRQLPVFGTVTQRSVALHILLCRPLRLFCVVFSICFHLLPPARDTREILYRAPALYTEVSAEACFAQTRRIPGRVAYTCWMAVYMCVDYEMKNTKIRASIAARNGIRT